MRIGKAWLGKGRGERTRRDSRSFRRHSLPDISYNLIQFRTSIDLCITSANMEDQVDRLVKKTWAKFKETPRSQRLMIAVSGIPGSGTQRTVARGDYINQFAPVLTYAPTGKTTLAALVAKRLNELHHTSSPGLSLSEDVAAFIPMDGYHLTREQLSAMPDPVTAHARRGAAFTFDAPAFLDLVQRLREPILPETKTLHAPSFDHATKDPKPDDLPITPEMRVLLFEGNYLSLGTGAREWKEAAGLMDELWFVQVEESVARQRLVKRHVVAGIARDEEEAGKRADENDLVNGREIVQGRLPVHEVIVSREDGGWRPEKQGVDETNDG